MTFAQYAAYRPILCMQGTLFDARFCRCRARAFYHIIVKCHTICLLRYNRPLLLLMCIRGSGEDIP